MIYSKITPAIVGQYLGISAQAVREGMERGVLPIGAVISQGEKKKYIILPKPLYDVTGIKLNGYEPPPVVDINYPLLAKEIAKAQYTTLAETFKSEGNK